MVEIPKFVGGVAEGSKSPLHLPLVLAHAKFLENFLSLNTQAPVGVCSSLGGAQRWKGKDVEDSYISGLKGPSAGF